MQITASVKKISLIKTFFIVIFCFNHGFIIFSQENTTDSLAGLFPHKIPYSVTVNYVYPIIKNKVIYGTPDEGRTIGAPRGISLGVTFFKKLNKKFVLEAGGKCGILQYDTKSLGSMNKPLTASFANGWGEIIDKFIDFPVLLNVKTKTKNSCLVNKVGVSYRYYPEHKKHPTFYYADSNFLSYGPPNINANEVEISFNNNNPYFNYELDYGLVLKNRNLLRIVFNYSFSFQRKKNWFYADYKQYGTDIPIYPSPVLLAHGELISKGSTLSLGIAYKFNTKTRRLNKYLRDMDAFNIYRSTKKRNEENFLNSNDTEKKISKRTEPGNNICNWR